MVLAAGRLAMAEGNPLIVRILGIKLQDDDPYQDEVTRGESILSEHGDTFVEEPPRVLEALAKLRPTGPRIGEYFLSLFPFLSWIGHYNLQWLIGDLVAGKFCLSRAV